MTKKDYIKLAEVIAMSTASYQADSLIESRIAAETIARHMAAMLAQDNPRFDRARFLKACGVAP